MATTNQPSAPAKIQIANDHPVVKIFHDLAAAIHQHASPAATITLVKALRLSNLADYIEAHAVEMAQNIADKLHAEFVAATPAAPAAQPPAAETTPAAPGKKNEPEAKLDQPAAEPVPDAHT